MSRDCSSIQLRLIPKIGMITRMQRVQSTADGGVQGGPWESSARSSLALCHPFPPSNRARRRLM